MKKRLVYSLLLVISLFFLGAFGSSAAPSTYVHGVFSEKPLLVLDGSNGQWLTPNSGNAIASWTENPLNSGNQAFFNAISVVGSDRYEFRLVHMTSTTADEIQGTFDIYKNYALVVQGIAGHVYGLSQPATGNNYYKFYDNAEKWGVSGYITSRLDY